MDIGSISQQVGEAIHAVFGYPLEFTLLLFVPFLLVPPSVLVLYRWVKASFFA